MTYKFNRHSGEIRGVARLPVKLSEDSQYVQGSLPAASPRGRGRPFLTNVHDSEWPLFRDRWIRDNGAVLQVGLGGPAFHGMRYGYVSLGRL